MQNPSICWRARDCLPTQRAPPLQMQKTPIFKGGDCIHPRLDSRWHINEFPLLAMQEKSDIKIAAQYAIYLRYNAEFFLLRESFP